MEKENGPEPFLHLPMLPHSGSRAIHGILAGVSANGVHRFGRLKALGPDTFAIGVCKPRGREAEPGDQRLVATDTRSPCLRGVHTPEHTRVPPSSPVN